MINIKKKQKTEFKNLITFQLIAIRIKKQIISNFIFLKKYTL